MLAKTTADEDVRGSDELAEAEASNKKRDRGGRETVAQREGAEAGEAKHAAGEDGETEARKDRNSAEKAAEEFGAEKDAALRIGEGPFAGERGQNRAQHDGAETG